MDMTPQEYQEYVKRLAPKSPIFKDTAFAFFIGGAICALGQLIQNGYGAYIFGNPFARRTQARRPRSASSSSPHF